MITNRVRTGSVEATGYLNEYEGIVDWIGYGEAVNKSGEAYIQGLWVFADGTEFQVPASTEDGGNFNYPVKFSEGEFCAVRRLYPVPVLDKVTGVAVPKSHFVFGRSLAEMPTLQQYIDAGYSGKPSASTTL